MAGEISRLIGEQGEKIVEKIFEKYLGYPNIPDNIKVPCLKIEEHSKIRNSKKEIKSHGNDGIVSSISKLEDEILEIGYISVKHSKKPYPKSQQTISSTYKKYFADLITAIECFSQSEALTNIQKRADGVSGTRIIGLLFWLTSNQESKNQPIQELASKSNLNSIKVPFDQLILIDNDRLQFIFKVVDYASKVSSHNYDFVYPNTGYNGLADSNYSFGKQMPLEFFSYSILPIRYQIGDMVILHLASKSNFSMLALSRILFLAKNFDKLLSSKQIVISFLDYHSSTHSNNVKVVLTEVHDAEFSKLIKVINLESDVINLLDE